MNKYNNPRLLNTVVSGTGMKNPVRPHVIIGSEENGFIRGDLMDANAIQELIVTEIAAREHGDEELTEYIDEKVQLAVDDLVDGAPEVLDTLKELSEALGDDANFATTITEEIASKVDKVEGKGLSTNDYTNAEKQKLAGIAAGAEVNVQSDWNVTSTSNDAFIKNKPTKLSQFTNDVPYATQDYIINNFETKTRVTELKQSIKEKIDNIESVLPKYDPTNGHEYVEIGGIKWATMNVGATSETDYGLYFQWGDTQGYTADQVGTDKQFTLSDHKFNPSGDGSTMTKYNSTDGKTVLDLDDDAARANWGGQWRIPTNEEIQTLVNAVDAVWTDNYNGSGINGLLCTDKTNSSKQLFFPAAGFVSSGNISNIGEECNVWSSSRDINIINVALYIYNEGHVIVLDVSEVYFGFSIRGVLDVDDVESETFVPVASKDDVDELKENLTFTETTDPANGHEYVDLGLPSGTKWATMNVGASSATDYGNYYMYGMGSKTYDSTDTPYSGTEDPLALSADTAAQEWGGDWHMPTSAQMQELIANTTYQWVTNYKGSGIDGGLFTATNGAVLFLPAAGFWHNGSQSNVGGDYWGSSPNGSNNAYYLYFGNGYKVVGDYNRKDGYPVRGVLDKDAQGETTITPVKEVVTDLKSNEEVIAAALNNLNTKIEATNISVEKANGAINDALNAIDAIPQKWDMDSSTFDAIFTGTTTSSQINNLINTYYPTFYVKVSSNVVAVCSIVRSVTQVCVFRHAVDRQAGSAIQDFRCGRIKIDGTIEWSDWTTTSSTVTPDPAA